MKRKNRDYPFYEHTYINNLKELIELRYKETPNDIAFSYNVDNEKVSKTYKEFYEEANSLANYYYKNYKKEHIGIIGENSYDWLLHFFGIILSGNIAVIFDKDCGEELFKTLMKKTDTKVIVYNPEYVDYISKLKYKTLELHSVDKYIKDGKKYDNKHVIDNCSLACIFFTSGTTGANKGVMLSNENMAFDIYSLSSIFRPDGNVLAVLPFHHTFGLITAVLKPFYYGVEIFINSSLKYVLKDLKNEHPDTLFVVPTFVETFYKQIWKTARSTKKDKLLKASVNVSNGLNKVGIDLRKQLFKSVTDSFGGNLHWIICGGAYLDVKYVKWFRSIGIEILNGYGITECSPVISVNRNEFYRDGSVGHVGRDQDVKIIDDEICVKGKNVMLGYYNDKKATDEVIVDGYFHTGDLGRLDENDFIYITGRKKNLIILSNGENVSPEEIEASLMKDEAVVECVVFDKDNKIIASIYPSDEYMGDQEYFDNLIYKYNEDKPKNRQIALVLLRTEEFIKNNNKKILRNKVLEEYK